MILLIFTSLAISGVPMDILGVKINSKPEKKVPSSNTSIEVEKNNGTIIGTQNNNNEDTNKHK